MASAWRSGAPDVGSASRRPVAFAPLAVLLGVGSLVGGGGTPSVIAEGFFVVAAIAIAMALVVWGGSLRPVVHPAIALLALALPAIAVLQLVPLPPALWQSLPGREALAEGLAAVGMTDIWWPLSIVPARTLAALLAFAPPLLAFALASQLAPAERGKCLWVMLAIGAGSALLGMVQAVGGDGFYLYPRSIAGFPSGLFANHNTQGDALLIALCAGVALWATAPGGPRRTVVAATLALVLLGLLLSGSRMAMVLLVVPAGLALWLSRHGVATVAGRRPRALLLVAAGILLLALVVFFSDNAVFSRVVERFGARSDPRFSQLWPDSWYAATVLFPVGTGLGTFPQAFEAVERLEILAQGYPNRAHLDYLELAIEAGAAGVAVLLAWTSALGLRLRSAFASTPRRYVSDPAAAVSWSICTIVAAHSLVDYTLRSIMLACLFAVSGGLLFARPGTGVRT